MKLTVAITETVRKKFVNHPMLIDGTTVVLGFHSATITGPNSAAVERVGQNITRWVQDQMAEGTTSDLKKKYLL